MKTAYNQEDKLSIIPSLIAGLGFLFIFLQLNIIAPLNHALSVNYHLSLSEIGLFSSSYLLGIALFYIPAGLLIDKYGPYRLILLGLAFSVMMAFIMANGRYLSLLVVSRFIGGIFHTLVFLSCLRIASNYYGKKMAIYVGLIITVGLLGGILSQYPFVKLISLTNWHIALNILNSLGVIIWIIIYSYFHRRQQWISHSLASSGSYSLSHLLDALKNPQNFLLGFYACLMDLPTIVIGTSWGNRLITEHFHLSNLSASRIIPWVFIGLMIGSPLSGWVSDYFKSRKTVMVIAAISLFILSFFWGNRALNIDGLKAITLLIGITSGFQVLSYTSLSEINKPQIQSLATGYASLIIMGGNAALMPLLGWIMSFHSHHIYTALIVIPVLLLVNICLMIVFGKEPPQRHLRGIQCD